MRPKSQVRMVHEMKECGNIQDQGSKLNICNLQPVSFKQRVRYFKAMKTTGAAGKFAGVSKKVAVCFACHRRGHSLAKCRLALGLCLLYGANGHMVATCPRIDDGTRLKALTQTTTYQ